MFHVISETLIAQVDPRELLDLPKTTPLPLNPVASSVLVATFLENQRSEATEARPFGLRPFRFSAQWEEKKRIVKQRGHRQERSSNTSAKDSTKI
jgi:hypothetical protein